MPDWLAVLDDALCHRFPHCFLCRAPAVALQIRLVDATPWYVVVRERCNTADGWARVDALLRALQR